MLERKMQSKLQSWKDAGANSAFVLLGARQTGKTHVVRRFARTSYAPFAEVNFLDREEDAVFWPGRMARRSCCRGCLS